MTTLRRYLIFLGLWTIVLLAAVLVNGLRHHMTGAELLAQPRDFAFLVPWDPWDLVRGWLFYASIVLGPPAVVAVISHWIRRIRRGQAA